MATRPQHQPLQQKNKEEAARQLYEQMAENAHKRMRVASIKQNMRAGHSYTRFIPTIPVDPVAPKQAISKTRF